MVRATESWVGWLLEDDETFVIHASDGSVDDTRAPCGEYIPYYSKMLAPTRVAPEKLIPPGDPEEVRICSACVEDVET